MYTPIAADNPKAWLVIVPMATIVEMYLALTLTAVIGVHRRVIGVHRRSPG